MSPATANILRHFRFDHLPAELQPISAACGELAHTMAEVLPDDDEVLAGLRHLLEAKDAFVRAAVAPR